MRIPRIVFALFIPMILTLSLSARATIINDTSVTVGDKEWAQVNLFTNLSWTDITAVCPAGACGDGGLNGHDVDGWTFASIADVGNLFFAVTGGAHGGGIQSLTEANSSWAPDFFDVLGFNPTNQATSSRFIQGSTLELSSGRATGAFILDNMPPITRLDIASTQATNDISARVESSGAWIYRPTSVPEPGSIILFAVGLIGLGLRRRQL